MTSEASCFGAISKHLKVDSNLLDRGQSRLRFWSQRANTLANGAASVKGETGVSFVRTAGYV